jgi:hypothetical protein
MTLTYGAGVACLWNALAGKPIPPLYLGIFGAIFLRPAGELRVEGLRLKVAQSDE